MGYISDILIASLLFAVNFRRLNSFAHWLQQFREIQSLPIRRILLCYAETYEREAPKKYSAIMVKKSIINEDKK